MRGEGGRETQNNTRTVLTQEKRKSLRTQLKNDFSSAVKKEDTQKG